MLCRAEYRVYKLKIFDQKTKKDRIELSTLMPTEYVGYNHLNDYESIILLDHWLCTERSDGFKPLCTKPKDLPAVEKKATSTALSPIQKPSQSPKK